MTLIFWMVHWNVAHCRIPIEKSKYMYWKRKEKWTWGVRRTSTVRTAWFDLYLEITTFGASISMCMRDLAKVFKAILWIRNWKFSSSKATHTHENQYPMRHFLFFCCSYEIWNVCEFILVVDFTISVINFFCHSVFCRACYTSRYNCRSFSTLFTYCSPLVFFPIRFIIFHCLALSIAHNSREPFISVSENKKCTVCLSMKRSTKSHLNGKRSEIATIKKARAYGIHTHAQIYIDIYTHTHTRSIHCRRSSSFFEHRSLLSFSQPHCFATLKWCRFIHGIGIRWESSK